MRTISRLSPVALTLFTALGAPGALAQSDAPSAAAAADAEAAAPGDDELTSAGELDDGTDAAGVDDAATSDDEPAADDDTGGEAVDAPKADAADETASAVDESAASSAEEGGFNVTGGDGALADGAAEDQAAHDAAVEVETDNLRRALYAGIGMGALGALAGVASIAATAGAVAMLTVPNLDPTIRTQGGPLLWFGISGILVGAVTTAAGGGLIGWSLLSDPEEAADAVGNADPDAATTQQNAPPMAR